MMAEFALTPSIFDETAHPDVDAWREQIRTLGFELFPRTGVWPVLISNLYAGGWIHPAERFVEEIQDHKAKALCRDLFTKIKGQLVDRPVHLDWPTSELEWGREAIESHKLEAIDRILTSNQIHTTLQQELKEIRCITEVPDAGFWSGIESARPIPMRIADQVQTLRKICLHSEFLCLVTPYIGGTEDDETAFAIDLLKCVLDRDGRFHEVEIEIHTEGPDVPPASSSYPNYCSNKVSNITTSLRTALSSGQSVDVYFWPKLLDRVIVGGTKADDSQNPRRPRWGMAMSHIARKPDERKANSPPTNWSLLGRTSIREWFDRYCKPGIQGFLPQTPFTVTG